MARDAGFESLVPAAFQASDSFLEHADTLVACGHVVVKGANQRGRAAATYFVALRPSVKCGQQCGFDPLYYGFEAIHSCLEATHPRVEATHSRFEATHPRIEASDVTFGCRYVIVSHAYTS
jgi:hypothetical protein